MTNGTQLVSKDQAMEFVWLGRNSRSALRMPLYVQPIFGGTTKEGKRGTGPWQSVGEQRESEIDSLNLGAKPVFGGTTKEGKRGTGPWQSVGEQRESEIDSLNLGAKPVFGGTTKEGKRGTYDV